MSDESGLPPEAPLIDARSPAERWAEAGRAGLEHLRQYVDRAGLDAAALAWMCALLAFTALQVYSALRLGSGADWWTKAAILSESGSFLLIFGTVAGVVVAAFFETRPAGLTLRLALAAGTWVVLAGLLGIVLSLHSSETAAFATRGLGEGQVVSVLFNVCYAGLGVLMAVLAVRLDGARSSRSDDEWQMVAS